MYILEKLIKYFEINKTIYRDATPHFHSFTPNSHFQTPSPLYLTVASLAECFLGYDGTEHTLNILRVDVYHSFFNARPFNNWNREKVLNNLMCLRLFYYVFPVEVDWILRIILLQIGISRAHLYDILMEIR